MAAPRRRKAFVVYLRPGDPQLDALPEAMRTNELILGWSEAEGLLNHKLSRETFTQIIKDTYKLDSRQAGQASGSLWRFLREMEKGDLVVIPDGDEFYLAEVEGDACYVPQKITEDRCYRRPVKWLKNYQPVQRGVVSTGLQKALQAQQTCTLCHARLFGEIEKLAHAT